MATKNSMAGIMIVMMLFVLLGIPGVAADAADGDEDECWGGGMEFNSWGFWMGLMMLGMFCGVMFLIVLLFFRDDARGLLSGGGRHESALSILDERYARGELPKQEYMRMKDDIKR